ncbi:acetyltransferase (GNAT) family protein [Aliiruegeria haliotis]|uniref:Acetyltransferase (GNAT) family protein n=1 Tax=Aliiruegeria haliotis TaxID=1280846 RepID=A0A2T0RT03_9RHOB|nr:GNAT family N-acetyltransferase [Aliiruegeria haliotis]PRY24314.1 acetyltransferase (GNAT) family protein [Aliiruegeria haliotis]
MSHLEALSEIRSLGFRSDFLVLAGESMAEVHPDRIVLRTPDQPDFWWGNLVLFRDGQVDPVTQPEQFRADFPQAAHVLVAWDDPAMTVGPGHSALAEAGYEVESMDVLTLSGNLVATPPPENVDIRPIETDADWEKVIALQCETGLEEGFERASYEAFLRQRFASRRCQIAEGWGRWFGAFDGDLLVGDLGIFVAAGIARYQRVETRASHRRRGICAALVTEGVNWARSRDPNAVPVIVALSDGPAGRVYRRCGFAWAESQVAATLQPKGAKVSGSSD